MNPCSGRRKGSKRERSVTLGQAVARFGETWLPATGRSPKTIRAYTTDLRQFASFVGPGTHIRRVSDDDVTGWLAELSAKEYGVASLRRKLAAVRVFLRYCCRMGHCARRRIEALPNGMGRPPRVTEVLDGDEIGRMLNWLRRRAAAERGSRSVRHQARRDYAVVRLALATGVRVGELVGMRNEDVALDRGWLRVTGKGNRVRLVPLADGEDTRCLREYVKSRLTLGGEQGPVFVRERGGALTTDEVRRMIKRVAKQAGLKRGVWPHMLRHTAATRLLEHGANLRVVQEFLGHRSIRSTERYTHVSHQSLRLAVERCHPLKSVA